MSNRSLTVQMLCPHHRAEPHISSSRSGKCEEGRTVTLDESDAVRLRIGYVINVSEIIDAVLTDGIRPAV